jgi:two-component system LytT family response regulator
MIKAILIDDEVHCIDTLSILLADYCPEVEVMDKCMSAKKGLEAIEKLKPELVFLDIEMPRMNGFRMLEELQDVDAEIIFTTAYNHYAIDAIRISAFDYLMKPISVEDLQNAVSRLMVKHKRQTQEKLSVLRKSLQENRSQEDRIAIPTGEGMEFINIKNIVRVESSSNYSKLHLLSGQILLVTRLLKDFEEMLLPYRFYRVHHSHVINLTYIAKYIRGEGGQVVMQNGDVIDVARRKKDEFLKLIAS